MTLNFRRLALITAVAALSIGAGKPTAQVNWMTKVAVTPSGGHVIGNPQAAIKLAEYVSYTCSHCAEFEKEASGELALGFIRGGKGSLELRPFFRNAVDVAATLMVACGDPARFAGNHAAMLRSQEKWLINIPEAQQRRWQTITDFGARMRAIASDLKFYPMFEARGYQRAQLDKCLANDVLAKQIAQENKIAAEVGSVNGTPSFLINDRPQDAGNWTSLRPVLMELTR